jgi:hypothetical protein
MLPKDDPTSIGAILAAMGVITEEQLRDAVQEQHNVRMDVMLGKLLLADGIISARHLETALQSQQDLRSGKKHKRAMAQSRIAEQGVGAIMSLAAKLRSSVNEAKEKITGTEFPRITADMVAGKKSDS